MFNSNGNGYSLSDIAAVTDSNRSNSGFGDGDGAWWIILIFLFAFGGWGNNGFGGFGGNGGAQGALTRADLTTDMNFNGLDSAVRGVQQGLCDGFYAMNTGMLNGFSGLANNLTTEFRGLDNAVCTLGYQTQAGINDIITANNTNTNAITSQLSNMAAQNAACCCETQRLVERGFADMGYNMATQACDTRRAIADSTRDLLENQNANTRSILDFLTNDKIATLTAENQGLKSTIASQAQTTTLINELKPCPVPAYVVSNPYCGCNTFGYNNICNL